MATARAGGPHAHQRRDGRTTSSASRNGTRTGPRARRTAVQPRADAALSLSGVLPIRALQPEEVALPAVLALLLVEKVQAAGVERFKPLIPADVLQTLRAAAEVEAQHPEVPVMLGSRDGSGS